MYYKSSGGLVTVVWDAGMTPCADEYRVTFTDVAAGGVAASVITPDLSCAVRNLVQERKYTVNVLAYSAACNCGQQSHMDIVVTNSCDWIPPAKVVGLVVKAGVNQLNVCWDVPSNYGCVSEYRVKLAAEDCSYDDVTGWTHAISHGECVLFNHLAPGTAYKIAVQAYSAQFVGGSMEWVLARTKEHKDEQKQWTCTPDAGYPLCAAASMGLCEPMTCDMQARFGKCGEPWMRRIDWSKKSITQFCAAQCPCPTFLEIPDQKANTPWPPAGQPPQPNVTATQDSGDSCCKRNSYSYSPCDQDVYLSPFGDVVKVQYSVSKQLDGLSASASVGAIVLPSDKSTACGDGTCANAASASSSAASASASG